MNIRIVAFSLCSVLALPALQAADQPEAAAPAAPAAPAEPAARPARHREEQTELGKHMEKIGGAFRRLGRQIKDATKNEDSLALVATIKTNAQAAVNLKPAKTADIPADQQAKFLADYQEDMKHFLADVDKLEAALKAGNNDEAAAILKTMKTDMDEGHKEFQKKKPKRKEG